MCLMVLDDLPQVDYELHEELLEGVQFDLLQSFPNTAKKVIIIIILLNRIAFLVDIEHKVLVGQPTQDLLLQQDERDVIWVKGEGMG